MKKRRKPEIIEKRPYSSFLRPFKNIFLANFPNTNHHFGKKGDHVHLKTSPPGHAHYVIWLRQRTMSIKVKRHFPALSPILSLCVLKERCFFMCSYRPGMSGPRFQFHWASIESRIFDQVMIKAHRHHDTKWDLTLLSPSKPNGKQRDFSRYRY